ncbi:hypothetical protein MKK65_08125 [Methylobacterium sp. J-001]|uniref:hypothetical protein n=1 Tax=Methylobacterium sp. J-001 TaxID=2836609 RepID=UPI001FB9644C|nr:hypothetical protein [Methylobacterium sp. J-001]MCJ2116546.1 hypothetical protein [Methylobacterium sp. J-001]
MTIGFGSLPSFAGGDDQNPLSPTLQQFLQQQQLAQAQAPAAPPQDVLAATPPGFTGYAPQTPPTGVPTPVVQPGAQAAGAGLLSMLGPNSAEAATPDPGDIRGRFISTLQSGGLTNPNGLGAVAAYAQHESRYSPSNITGSWSDPSESGQAGQSGGILSWRADRLKAMKDFTAGAPDPVVAQAKFTLAENPALISALQSAQSPQEANRLMADAWKFAGYNRPGGENAARLATTQAYANSFASGQTLPGVSAPRGGSMGSTAQQGGFGLGGVVGQGAAVPGQASSAPGVASLSAQPLAVAPPPTGFSTDLAVQQQETNPYAQIGNALKSIAGGQQKQGQKAGGGMPGAPDVGTRPISLQQARAMFDPGKFYGMLHGAGVRGQVRGS